jgi:xylulokinase
MFVGLDLGTSGLKAILIGEDQTVLAEATSSLDVQRPHPGWSEQDPATWISSAERAFEALAAKHSLKDVRGIGLSGQMHGAVLIDSDDNVLRPAILWNDTRSHAEAAKMDADPKWRSISGNIVFPGFTAPKLDWLRKNDPEIFERTAMVLLPKDYLRFWLTGDTVSEMSDAAGTSWLDTGRRDWSDDLLNDIEMSRDQMPSLVEGTSASGTLRSVLASQWGMSGEVIVAGGGGDNAASAVGVGVVRPGTGFISLGTSGVLFAATDSYRPDPETSVHTFCHAIPETWHQMGVILAAADSLNWFAKACGSKPEDLTIDLGDLSAPGRTLFLPYLGGERTPHNDADTRASFIGVAHETDQRSLTKSVIEGVTHAFKDCHLALAATGTSYDKLIAIGGGSQSDYWLEAIATSLNIPIEVPVAGDFGAAFGAARLAIMATTGAGPDIAKPPKSSKTIDPNAMLTEAFSDAHDRYQSTYTALKGLS